MTDITERLRLHGFDEAASLITSLRSELEAARKDAERLDWLEATNGDISIVNDDEGHFAAADASVHGIPQEGEPLGSMTVFIDPDCWKPTAREAIDHAMAQDAIDSEIAKGA